MENLELKDIANNLFILNKITVDRLFSCENPTDAFTLYCFYYRQAKWQNTNTPKATNEYVKNGLHWGIDRINKAKDILKDLGLIEIVQRKKDGKIIGWFIKVHYIVSDNNLKIQVENLPNIQNTQKPQVIKTTSGFQKTNTNDNNKNTNDNNKNTNDKEKENIKEKEKEDLDFVENEDFKDLLKEWLEYKKEIKNTYKSSKSIKAFYNTLIKYSNNDIEKARDIINFSIANGYKGIIEPKQPKKQFSNNRPNYAELEKHIL